MVVSMSIRLLPIFGYHKIRKSEKFCHALCKESGWRREVEKEGEKEGAGKMDGRQDELDFSDFEWINTLCERIDVCDRVHWPQPALLHAGLRYRVLAGRKRIGNCGAAITWYDIEIPATRSPGLLPLLCQTGAGNWQLSQARAWVTSSGWLIVRLVFESGSFFDASFLPAKSHSRSVSHSIPKQFASNFAIFFDWLV